MIYEIETEEDYQEGLKRFIELSDSLNTDNDLKELTLLMNLMEKYERENCSNN